MKMFKNSISKIRGFANTKKGKAILLVGVISLSFVSGASASVDGQAVVRGYLTSFKDTVTQRVKGNIKNQAVSETKKQELTEALRKLKTDIEAHEQAETERVANDLQMMSNNALKSAINEIKQYEYSLKNIITNEASNEANNIDQTITDIITEASETELGITPTTEEPTN